MQPFNNYQVVGISENPTEIWYMLYPKSKDAHQNSCIYVCVSMCVCDGWHKVEQFVFYIEEIQ
jgi:hypothetical protein